MVVLGLAMFLGICWAVGRGIEQAANKVGEINKSHKAAWRKKHPKAVAAARWGGLTAAAIHGTPAMWRAFRHDWREHYGARRDEVRAKYGRAVPQPAPEPATAPATQPVSPPEWKPQPRPRTRPRPEPPAPDIRPAAAVAEPEPEGRPTLTLVRPITASKGTSVMAIATTELTTTAALRTAAEDAVKLAQAVSDDAADGAARSQAYLGRAQHIADAAVSILDRDPNGRARLAAMAEGAQRWADAEKARALAADQMLNEAQAALTALQQHIHMEEAAQATQQASTSTAVYRD